MKTFIDDNIDHRFIISSQDPGFERLVGLTVDDFEKISTPIKILDEVEMGRRTFDCSDIHLDSFVMVDFNPTSENLAKWIYEGVEQVIYNSPFDCKMNYVDWSETPKTHARFSRPPLNT